MMHNKVGAFNLDINPDCTVSGGFENSANGQRVWKNYALVAGAAIGAYLDL